jgi:hypothetical protein
MRKSVMQQFDTSPHIAGRYCLELGCLSGWIVIYSRLIQIPCEAKVC